MKWVKSEDKKPDLNTKNLVYDARKGMFKYSIATYYKGSIYYGSGCYWMPLPDPPS